MAEWKFLTNHALVLGWIANHPQSTAREMANAIGVTERTALKIVGELDTAGYITRRRKGRRNIYRVNAELPMRPQAYKGVPVGSLLSIIAPKKQRAVAGTVRPRMAKVTELKQAQSA